MDETRPPIPPIDFLLRSASERTSADVAPPPMASARSDEPSAVGWQTTPRAGNASLQGRKAVKTCSSLCLLPICVLLFACGPTASRSSADAIMFDMAERLADFDFIASGDGGPGNWSVVDNDAGRGLAQTGPEPNENRLAFAFYRPFSERDVYVSTRFLTNTGKNDQAAGLVVRFRSPGDY
ncbi:hypothetical protein [Bradyrhizobium sp. LA6.8]|uniref:hypothetical protein n=2 Tax=Bradyrhizobium TaxID=374 RepID=UPI0033970053